MFQNRQDAALRLAHRLEKYRGEDGIVLAIPRGGVPIGYVIAQQLGFPLEVVLSKKIGHPNNSEYAIGSVSLDSVAVDERTAFGIPAEYIQEQAARIQAKLRENFRLFMDGRPPTNLKGKTVIVVDDGIATGHTMVATVEAIRKSRPAKLIVAVPVAPPHAQQQLAPLVDEFVCLLLPRDFAAVGQFYVTFDQVSDEEVIRLLRKSAAGAHGGAMAN
ncbi:phosphoribosyltransferase family protein [Hymenobacter sp. BT770]|uniref:phosphoribosyltransferase n=1 Tax=Hymenobacter sp. BT770 TaxID=2886942 RepID=UPI001D11DBF4|nr:phosphoribosyltransferase family protein [Hymenobacter sp. BT770]MCC3155454.1 phosphoribosyltransferase [Hymenobacter sp. BT770]MDO3417461.1 phosphoribosyltransferase family protein [Hymenobacter sp. BT770]